MLEGQKQSLKLQNTAAEAGRRRCCWKESSEDDQAVQFGRKQSHFRSTSPRQQSFMNKHTRHKMGGRKNSELFLDRNKHMEMHTLNTQWRGENWHADETRLTLSPEILQSVRKACTWEPESVINAAPPRRHAHTHTHTLGFLRVKAQRVLQLKFIKSDRTTTKQSTDRQTQVELNRSKGDQWKIIPAM